ncbi:hypothetical protein LEP1GSC060_3973 [Leptospira weilii serovar Ranarum str. ICFT]|uniref:Uncharacterized protein n=1 Tax=Leptospira weilii serovar Ranarum str. ICFT TaxID=1218598 RepID=N1WMQ4_9LEPT|nr:hypothetical protein LEP1GSC060_3973 [Leptospira weilii serovar Ranarum str. ICFT]
MKRNLLKITVRRIGNFTYFLIVFNLIWNCNNLPNGDDSFNRDNEKRVILQYLLLPPTDPIQSCINSLQAAQSCLNQAP